MFLVTGTGRCGTTWCYETLNQVCNVRHQSLRHEHVLGDSEWVGLNMDGEISHEAAPVMNMFDTKVLVWRDCEKTMRSWMQLGLFVDGWEEPFHMFYRNIEKHCDNVLRCRTLPDSAALFWFEWNKLCVENADYVFMIDMLTPASLCDAVNVTWDYDCVTPPHDTNTRRESKSDASFWLNETSFNVRSLVDDMTKFLLKVSQL